MAAAGVPSVCLIVVVIATSRVGGKGPAQRPRLAFQGANLRFVSATATTSARPPVGAEQIGRAAGGELATFLRLDDVRG